MSLHPNLLHLSTPLAPLYTSHPHHTPAPTPNRLRLLAFAQVLRDTLLLSKAVAGKLELSMAPLLVREQILQHIRGMLAHAAKAGVQVVVECAESLPSVGDLTLLPGSPCLNAGDPGAAMAVVKDHDENSRLLDHDLSGAMLPDVGAYERPVWTMDVVGEPVLGTTLTFTVSGPPGLSIYFLGFLDGTLLISPYGFLTAGLFSAVELGTVPVGTPFPVPVPDVPSLVGLNVGIQTGTIPLSSVLVGNATNLYRGILSR